MNRRTIPDPLAELFASCENSEGELQDDLVRCALASAFRRGYASCLDKMPQITMDGCLVAEPTWPLDEGRVAELEAKFRKEYGM